MRFEKAPRIYGWRNFKMTIARILDGSDWRNGRDSGFPPCCRTYFTLRSASMEIWQMIFGNYGFFVCPIRYGVHNPEQAKYRNMVYPRHVICPYHKIAHFGKDWSNSYHTCPNCGWVQYENDKCNRC